MKQWKKHTIGKRILASCLLITMLFDTVTASATNLNEEGGSQIELVGTVPEQADAEETMSEEAVSEIEASEDILEDTVSNTDDSEQILEQMMQESEVSEVETEEPIAVEDLKMTEQAFGIFEDVEVMFSGYTASVRGTFTSNFPGEYYDIYLISYNSADEELYSGDMGVTDNTSYILGHGDESWRHMPIAKDTAYVRLKVSPLNSGLEAGTVYSEKFVHMEEPDFSLVVEDVTAGLGAVTIGLTCTGDLAATNESACCSLCVDFIGGSSDEESTWSVIGHKEISLCEGEKISWYCWGLNEGVTYYGKLRLYSGGYNQLDGMQYINYEQEIPLESFQTKAEISYDLKTAFPDNTLRKWVINYLSKDAGYYIGEGTVTNLQLEKITKLDLNYNGLSEEPVRDITGVELLTNVTEVYLDYNEINTVTQTDWSKLTNLESLYLKGNNITQFPDLSKNAKLSYVDLDDNMLSESELETVQSKLSADTAYTTTLFSSQRSALAELVLEEKYDSKSVAVPFTAVLKGQKNYEARLFFDGVECKSAVVEDDIIFVKDSGLSVGTHTVKAELYNGDTKVRETEIYTFQIVGRNTACFCAYDEAIGKLEVAFGQSYENQEISVTLRQRPEEEGYPVIAKGNAVITGEAAFIELYHTDGTAFVPTLDVYYCEITVGEDIYANWLYPAYYEKEAYNYWEGSTVIESGSKYATIDFYSDLAYSDYSGKDGIRVTAKLLGEDLSVVQRSVGVTRNRWAANYTRFTMKLNTSRLREGNYTLVLYEYKSEKIIASTEIIVGAGTDIEENWNYWAGSTLIQKTSADFSFYSDILLQEYRTADWEIVAEVSRDGAVDSEAGSKVGYGAWKGDYVEFSVGLSNLQQGEYTLTLYKVYTGYGDEQKKELLSSTEFTVYLEDKPILTSVTASLVSYTELKVEITGIDIVAKNPTIELYDAEGNKVSYDSMKFKKNRTYWEVTIKGLDYSNISDGCYIKVLIYSRTDKTHVEPYQANGTPYYSSEEIYGKYVAFDKTALQPVLLKSEKRISGIGVTEGLVKNIKEVPITIRFYKAYNGELVKEVPANRFRGDAKKQYYYCFNKGLWESLPEKDATYDIEVEAGGKLLGRFSGVIGYEKWYYSVEKTEFYLDSSSPKKAELTVINAGEEATFESSNPEVAKLTPSTESSNAVTITAGKLGTAEITITADGYSKTFTVTVANLPKVKAQSSVVINSFFGDAKAELELTNSYETAVTSVTIAETEADEEGNTNYIGLDTQEIDGKWYLCWDGETTIPKDKKITLKYEVEGFTTTEEDSIAPQKVTVNVKKVTPETVLSPASVNFTEYPYKEQYVDLSVKNNKDRIMIDPEDIILVDAPEGVLNEDTETNDDAEELEDLEDNENTIGIGVTVTYDAENNRLVVNADNNAVNGTYKFRITPWVDDMLCAKPAVLTVNLKGTKPAFKFNTTSVTLDAAYPGESQAEIKLLMDEGYVLEEAVITAPNDSINDFIRVESKEDGTIIFKMEKAGLAAAGNYMITAKIRAPWGSVYEMAAVKVSVKLTNSSKVTLSSKSKAVTVNPYVGSAEVKANLTVKGFTKQDSVNYTTQYEFIPTNELAKNASIGFSVDESGIIQVSDCNGYGDGKYTYNLIGVIVGTDGTVTYTKPLAFTVQIQAKKLTIVPEKSSVTVYKEYCATNGGSYVVEIPVSVKELSEAELDFPLITSMEENEVYARFNEDGTKVVVEFPTELTGVKNLNITPEDENSKFGTFKVSITVKNTSTKASFTKANVTLNRYLATEIVNTVADTEGYTIDALENIVIKNKRNEDVTEQFEIDPEGNKVTIRIAEGDEDTISNGNYTVSVVPMIDIETDIKPLAECKFTLKLEQPKLKVSVGEEKKSSLTVNLYPQLDEVTSETFELNVYCGDDKLKVSKIELSNTASENNIIVDEECVSDKEVGFVARANKDGVYKRGKNTFKAVLYVRNVNGDEDIKAGTLKSAFVVNVRDLPKSISLVKTGLTYSPYIESSVATSIKSAELEALMKTGKYRYSITAEETKSNYKTVLEEENGIIQLSFDEKGNITVDNVGLPTKNATYYYKLTVDFGRIDGTGETFSYPAKLKVSVKNTLPKAALQAGSISLDNAFVNQKVTNKVVLTTGTGLWNLDALSDADIVVKSGKKNVTDAGYFDITYSGTGFTVSLNNRDTNGKLMTVPKGTYKIEITPKITEKKEEMNDALKSALKVVTLTVKVASNRPTVKLASSVKVEAGGEAGLLVPTLKNKGTLTDLIILDRKLPKRATKEDLEGIEVKLEDGVISVKAAENVFAGTYTFKIQPVTKIDGEDILLDAKTIKITVK